MMLANRRLDPLRFSFRLGVAALIASSSLALSGCNLCCPPYMDDYATVGGKWVRADPTEGRVGSAFSDPGVVQAAHQTTEAVPGFDYAPPINDWDAYSSDLSFESEFVEGFSHETGGLDEGRPLESIILLEE